MKMKIQSKNGHKIININRRIAIHERCLNCSGWMPSSVRNCEHNDCDLYPYRSGKGKQDPKARAKAIRAFCLWCMNGQRYEVSKCTGPDCSLFPFRQSRVDRSVEIIDSKPKKRRIERRRRIDTPRPIPKYRSTVTV
jgi:hypothetical protein